ncbi:IS600 orfAB' transposase [Escherichia coli]|uniref:IS600 orfAB' transposase n=1 Tax=Escherichia coli TaxID=562 RepID=A0A376J3M6_ECOLX|nr:IS600 orfAB' transposase [Escherichia coli]
MASEGANNDRKTQRYSKEFKAEAVRTVLENQLSISEGTSRLSLPEGTLGQWVTAARKGLGTPGSRTVAELESEILQLRKALNEARLERDILNCTGVAEKYAFNRTMATTISHLKRCVRYLVYPGAVITTGVQHEPSDRKQSDERLKLEIKVAHIRTRETYGTRRLQTELAENGIIVGRDRLARLRKELRLRCKQKRKFRATTNSNHNLPVAPNLLNQTFAPTAKSGLGGGPDVCCHTGGMVVPRWHQRCLYVRNCRLRHGRAHDKRADR